MDSNYNIATDRFSTRKPRIEISDEKIVESLQNRLNTTLKGASTQPVVKERMAKVSEIFTAMPHFWRQKPSDAQGSLERFASGLTAEQKESLFEISSKLDEVNASLTAGGKQIRKTLPSVVSLLNDIAQPHLAEENFKARIVKVTDKIARRASEADLSANRKIQRRSMYATLQPSQTPTPDSHSSRNSDVPRKRPKSVGPDLKQPPVPELDARCTQKNPGLGIFALYKQQALRNGKNHERFDSIMESKILPSLPRASELSPEKFGVALKKLCNKRLDYEILKADPYQMLGTGSSLQAIEADNAQLMPLLLKMLNRAHAELEVEEVYIGTLEFITDAKLFKTGLKQTEADAGETLSARLASNGLTRKKSPNAEEGRYRGTTQSYSPYTPRSPRPGTTFATTTPSTGTTIATNTTTTTTATRIATSPAVTAMKNLGATSTATANIRRSATLSTASETDQLSATSASSAVLFSDPRTFNAALKFGPRINEKFGPDAAMEMLTLLKVLLDTAVERRDMEPQAGLRHAIAKANLGIGQQALKQVWNEVQDNPFILGVTDEAFLLRIFLRTVASAL